MMISDVHRDNPWTVVAQSAKEAVRLYFEPIRAIWVRRGSVSQKKAAAKNGESDFLNYCAALLVLLVAAAIIFGLILIGAWASRKIETLPIADTQGAVLLCVGLILAIGAALASKYKKDLPRNLAVIISLAAFACILFAIQISVHPIQSVVLALACGAGLLGLIGARLLR
jgi:hypothetical protein